MLRQNNAAGSSIALVLGLLAAGGCGSSSSGPSTPDFTITTENTSLSLARGESKTTFLKATRAAGYDGAISFGITESGGLTIGIFSTSAPDSERVEIAVPTPTSTGIHNVNLTASGPGAATQRVTIVVAVTAAPDVASWSFYFGTTTPAR
jgi:hypothetical protein